MSDSGDDGQMDTFVAVVCALRASVTIGPGSTSSAATTAPVSHGLQAPRRACHLRSYGREHVEETGEASQNMLRRLRFDGKTSPSSQQTSDATVRSTGRDLPTGFWVIHPYDARANTLRHTGPRPGACTAMRLLGASPRLTSGIIRSRTGGRRVVIYALIENRQAQRHRSASTAR